MGRRRKVYAFVLVAIYVVATLLSSISLLTCDHHHHHHHICKSECCCACEGDVISQDCCDHEHPILGDNHTDFISSLHRSDSRVSASMAWSWILAPAVVPAIVGEQPYVVTHIVERVESPDTWVLQTPYVAGLSLRAPPVLA